MNGKQHVWQNPILVTAPASSLKAQELRQRPVLPPGEYLIRILVDQTRQTEKQPAHELASKDQVAEVQIAGKWKPGYQPPRIIRFPRLKD